MKAEIDLTQQLYVDEIIPIYLLEEKLKANFISIQRRLKQAQERSSSQQQRISYLEKSISEALTEGIQKTILSKLIEHDDAQLPVFREQISNQVQSKFREIKLQFPIQIRRQSQSLISTELMSIRRIIGQTQFSKGEGTPSKSFGDVVSEYSEQRLSKRIDQLGKEISATRDKLRSLEGAIENNKTITSGQINQIIKSIGEKSRWMSGPIQRSYLTETNCETNDVRLRLEELNNKMLNLVPMSQFQLETAKTKEQVSNVASEVNLLSKQFHNADEVYSLIVKVNSNVQHLQKQYEGLRSTSITKDEAEAIVVSSLLNFEKGLKERDEMFSSRLRSQKERSSSQNRQIGQINQRIIQLQRLNNYEEYMESMQKVLDKHHVEEPPNPKRTLYMDYIHQLERKVQTLNKDVRTLTQKLEVQVERGQVLQVTKSEIDEVWKAIMILQAVIEGKPHTSSNRRKPWSQKKTTTTDTTHKQEFVTPQKTSQTFHIKRIQTQPSGGLGQKAVSSKNIRHLTEEKPQRLQRDKDRLKRQSNQMKQPQIPRQSKQWEARK